MNFDYLLNKLSEKMALRQRKKKKRLKRMNQEEKRERSAKQKEGKRGKERERDEDDLKVRKKEIRNNVLVDFKFILNFLLSSSSTAPDTLLSFVQGVHLYI
jgi:hypothetical protein